MPDTLFQYPGGKSRLAEWIVSNMPQHECYVEGFGGSGAVLLNKPKAEVNVYNDLDSDLVHFFTVYRESPERLIEWVEGVPMSYEKYEEFCRLFYGEANEDPEDEELADPLVKEMVGPDDVTHGHVQRAGMFFCLRYMQFGSKYHGRSGFGRSKVQNGATTFTNAKERLKRFIGFYDDVILENVSYEKLIGTYDGDGTVFYFDPPYIGTEDYYRESDFDHQKFCKELTRIDGYWMVSYDTIPEELEQYTIQRKESTNFIDSGVKGEGKETTETLVMNFDPEDHQLFTGRGQTSLSDVTGGTKQQHDTTTQETQEGSSESLFGDTQDPQEDGIDELFDEEGGDDDTSGWLTNAE